MKTESWRRDILGIPDADGRLRVIPFDQWPDDDPFRRLCRVYQLSAGDLAKVLTEIGGELEVRAMRAGYEDAWVLLEEE